MEKKYFTSKMFLVLGTGLIAWGIVIFCYPYFFEEMNEPLFHVIFSFIGLASVGGAYWLFRSFCFHPVFTKDSLLLKNPVISSRNRVIKYSEMNYATVNKQATGKGQVYLQLHIGLKDGENFGYSLMTDVKQMDELKNEFKEHGVTEEPVLITTVKKTGDMVYRSNGMLAMFSGLILMLVGLFIFMYTTFEEDVTSMLLVGGIFLGCCLLLMWYSNYVCVEHNRVILKNFFMPFRNREIYFSDIKKTKIDEMFILTITLKHEDKKVKRLLGLFTPNMVEALRVRLKLENK